MEIDAIAGWLIALALAAAMIALAPRAGRSAAVGCGSLLLLYGVVLAVAGALLEPSWRPAAPAIAAAAVWLAVQPLRALGSLPAESIGLVAPKPRSVAPAIVAAAAVFALEALLLAMHGIDRVEISTGIVVAAIVAAVVEELVMRGVLLALADQALPPRRSVAHAPIGAGGVLLTAAFVALHGARVGVVLGVAPLAFLYLWLRARTGSLAPPVVVHLLWNLLVVVVHR